MGDFEGYERTFLRITNGLPSRISALTTYESNPTAVLAEARKLELEVKEAKQNLDAMKMSVPQVARQQYTEKLRMYKGIIDAATADLSKTQRAAERASLVSSSHTPDDANVNITASAGDRERVLKTTERISSGNQKLLHVRQTLVETHATAGAIEEELARNRDTLVAISGKVDHVSDATHVARRILGRMSKREIRIKIMVAFFIMLILGLIILMIYLLSRK